MNYQTAVDLDLSLPALRIALYWEARGAASVGTLAQAIRYSERAVRGALAELRAAGLSPRQNPAHDHELQHGDPKEPGEDLPPLVQELTTHGIFPESAARLVATYGEDRVRVQLAHHQARLDGGFTFRKAPAAHLHAAIVHDYAPWVPVKVEGLPRKVQGLTPPQVAVDYASAPSREEANAGFARHREAIRAALGRR